MEIKEFCADSTTAELQQYWQGCEDLMQEVLKKCADADIVGCLSASLKDGGILDLSDEALELSVGFLANRLNMEIIEKEMFRRKMEEHDI